MKLYTLNRNVPLPRELCWPDRPNDVLDKGGFVMPIGPVTDGGETLFCMTLAGAMDVPREAIDGLEATHEK